jgi:hypothetical protein
MISILNERMEPENERNPSTENLPLGNNRRPEIEINDRERKCLFS